MKLSDPYSCLFEGRERALERNRELAIGLLTVLSQRGLAGGGPKIVVISGPASRRFRLDARSMEAETVHPVGKVLSPETVIQATFPLLGPRPGAGPIDLARACCENPVRPFALEVDGCPVGGQVSSEKDSRLVSHNGLRVSFRLRFPADRSLVRFYSCGLRVGDAARTERLPGLQVEADVNDDDFTLDVSRSSVVRDARYNRAMEALTALGLEQAVLVFHQARTSYASFGEGGWSRAVARHPYGAEALSQLRLECAKLLAVSPQDARLTRLRGELFFSTRAAGPAAWPRSRKACARRRPSRSVSCGRTGRAAVRSRRRPRLRTRRRSACCFRGSAVRGPRSSRTADARPAR